MAAGNGGGGQTRPYSRPPPPQSMLPYIHLHLTSPHTPADRFRRNPILLDKKYFPFQLDSPTKRITRSHQSRDTEPPSHKLRLMRQKIFRIIMRKSLTKSGSSNNPRQMARWPKKAFPPATCRHPTPRSRLPSSHKHPAPCPAHPPPSSPAPAPPRAHSPPQPAPSSPPSRHCCSR